MIEVRNVWSTSPFAVVDANTPYRRVTSSAMRLRADMSAAAGACTKSLNDAMYRLLSKDPMADKALGRWGTTQACTKNVSATAPAEPDGTMGGTALGAALAARPLPRSRTGRPDLKMRIQGIAVVGTK
jgi:hypothetical protein